MQHIIKDRDDITVARSGGTNSMITKQAKTEAGRRELSREHAFLIHLADTGYVPKVYGFENEGPEPHALVERIVMEDVGESHEITNEYDFRTSLIQMLNVFRVKHVIHGDLTSANVRIVDNAIKVIDWGESRFFNEHERDDKRPEGDTWHAWNFASQWSDGARVARRWHAIYNSIVKYFGPAYIPGSTLLDLGCFHGDVAAAASAAGMLVHGVDENPDAIETATARWKGLPLEFETIDVTDLGGLWNLDAVTCLSMYPYVEQRHGIIVATRWLQDVIESTKMLFFECQLAGDGPGPSWMVDTDRVQSFLENCGGREVERIIEIVLPDRDTTRTVFKILGGS